MKLIRVTKIFEKLKSACKCIRLYLFHCFERVGIIANMIFIAIVVKEVNPIAFKYR